MASADDDLFDDPDYRDAALLGWLEGELRRAGWQHADALAALTTRLIERVEPLHQAVAELDELIEFYGPAQTKIVQDLTEIRQLLSPGC